MKINEANFPILGCTEKNYLKEKVFEMLDDSGYDKTGIEDIKPSFDFFINKQLQINYITTGIHEKLWDTSNFIKAKSLLKNSPETLGLIILPKTIIPDFSHVPDYVSVKAENYPINAILYSWLSPNNYDRISNEIDKKEINRRISNGEKPPLGADWDSIINSDEDEDDIWDEETNKNRELFIIPIHDYRITQATKRSELVCYSECYGDNFDDDGREWYGQIFDYVMSFILFYNYTETETHVVHGIETGEQRRLKINNEKFLNETKNNIEIIDSTYFTKLIRTGEFGVSGHFRVQHFGPSNSESKIVFIESYKKNGYIRNAKKQ